MHNSASEVHPGAPPPSSRFRHKDLDGWGRFALVATGLVIVLAFASWTFLNHMDRYATDATADWLAASAAVDGLDPYTDLTVLGVEYGVAFPPIGQSELGDIPRVHPRTPGALLLLSPLTLLPVDWAYPTMLVINSLTVVVLGLVLLPRLIGYPRRTTVMASIGVVGFSCFLTTLEFGTQSGIVMILVAVMWVGLSSGNTKAAGVSLAVASTLKLYPALFCVAFARHGYRRAIWVGLMAFASLNVAGMIAFRISPMDTFSALASSGQSWIALSLNGSPAMPLVRIGIDPTVAAVGVAIMGGLAALVLSGRGTKLDSVAIVAPIALLAVPLSWNHYDLVLVPVAAYLLSQAHRSARKTLVITMVGLWILIQYILTVTEAALVDSSIPLIGLGSQVGRLALLFGGLWLAASRSQVEDVARSNGR